MFLFLSERLLHFWLTGENSWYLYWVLLLVVQPRFSSKLLILPCPLAQVGGNIIISEQLQCSSSKGAAFITLTWQDSLYFCSNFLLMSVCVSVCVFVCVFSMSCSRTDSLLWQRVLNKPTRSTAAQEKCLWFYQLHLHVRGCARKIVPVSECKIVVCEIFEPLTIATTSCGKLLSPAIYVPVENFSPLVVRVEVSSMITELCCLCAGLRLKSLFRQQHFPRFSVIKCQFWNVKM